MLVKNKFNDIKHGEMTDFMCCVFIDITELLFFEIFFKKLNFVILNHGLEMSYNYEVFACPCLFDSILKFMFENDIEKRIDF